MKVNAKYSFQKLCILFLAVFLSLFCIFNAINSIDEAEAATIKYSGTSGSCSWSIDSDGLLRIWPTNGTSGTLATSQYEKWAYEGASYFFPWTGNGRETSVTKVVVEKGVKTNTSASAMFHGMSNCTEMDLSGLDTSNATTLMDMFRECSSLTSLDLSSFNTSRVVEMHGMFARCYDLETVNLSSFNTSNVYYGAGYGGGKATSEPGMGWMFSECYSLKELDLSNFNTSKVSSISYMFYNCISLRKLDLSSFTVRADPDSDYMDGTFYGCSMLEELDIRNIDTTNFNTKYGYSMRSTFKGTSNLRKLILGSKFKFMDTHSLEGTWLKTENLNGTLTNNTTAYSPSVIGTSTIGSAGVWRRNGTCWWEVTQEGTLLIHPTGTQATIKTNTSYCEEVDDWVMPWVHEYRNKIVKVYVDPGVYAPVYPGSLFGYLPNCKEMDLGNLNTSNTESLSSLFYESYGIEILDAANWDTSKITSMSYLFNGCTQLKQVDLSGWNTSNVTSMRAMFQQCSSLISLDLSSFNTSKVTDMGWMFWGCSSLKSLDMRNFDTSAVTSEMFNMFVNDVSLQKIVFGTKFKFYNVTNLPDVNNWVKVRNLNNTKTYSTTEYTFSQLSTFNSTTNPSIGGIWTRYGMDDNFDINPDGTIEYISNNDEWVMESDEVWTYTFKVFDDTLVYYLYEEIINGYISEAMYPYYITVKDNQATIINTVEGKIGRLSVTKQVTGNIPESERNRSFKFVLTLSGKDIAGTQRFGDTIFENGLGSFYLQNGLTKVFELPAGTSFTIKEDPVTSYVSSVSPTSGVVTADNVINIQAVNTYVETPVVEPDMVNITLKKTLENSSIREAFGFSAYFTGLSASKEYKMSNNKTFTSTEDGNGFCSFQLTADESVVFYNIPVNATYQFTEEAGNYISSYVVTNQSAVGEIARENDKNEDVYADLSTAIETADKDESIVVEFKNRLKTVQNLSITKTVKEEQEDGSLVDILSDDTYFEFTINFSNIPKNKSFSSAIGKIVPDSEGNSTKTFYLQNGQTIDFYDIPVEVKYQITESANRYRPSYLITGLSVVKNVDESNHTWQSLSTEIESFEENENASVIFTNVKPLTKDQYIYLKKTINALGNDSIIEALCNNKMYQLSGAKYEIVINGNVVETLTTDENGEAVSQMLFEDGTNGIIRETKAPQGFMLDDRDYYFAIDTSDGNDYHEIAVSDIPTLDPTVFSFKKVDSETSEPQGGASFQGAVFKYEYFDNLNWSGMATRTWYFETNEDGLHTYHADYLADGYASDDLYTGISDTYQIPMGSVKITEIESPAGYKEIPELYATIIQEVSGAGAKWVWTEETLEFLKNSSSNLYELEEPIDEEKFGSVTIQKLDKKSGTATPADGATFEGIEFTIYNKSANPVKIGDNEIANTDEACMVITVSADGKAQSGAVLPVGTYEIKETKGNDFYAINTEWNYTFTVDGTEDNPAFSTECINTQKPEVKILKVDNENNPLAGAVLQIKDAEGNVIAEWTSTTEDYTIRLDFNTYTLHEKTPPLGYTWAKDIEFTVTDGGYNTVIMVDVPLSVLVSTGGHGLTLTIMLAMVLGCATGVIVYSGRKKSKKNEEIVQKEEV